MVETFLVTIHELQAARGVDDELPASTPKAAREHEPAMPARILIVEDEYFIALEIERAVRTAGHAVIDIVGSAEDAVRIVESTKPDLVLMDIRLTSPRDGIDAAIELRQRFDVASVIVSSHIDPQTRSRAAPAKPRGFVNKPFLPAVLTRAIADALKPP